MPRPETYICNMCFYEYAQVIRPAIVMDGLKFCPVCSETRREEIERNRRLAESLKEVTLFEKRIADKTSVDTVIVEQFARIRSLIEDPPVEAGITHVVPAHVALVNALPTPLTDPDDHDEPLSDSDAQDSDETFLPQITWSTSDLNVSNIATAFMRTIQYCTVVHPALQQLHLNLYFYGLRDGHGVSIRTDIPTSEELVQFLANIINENGYWTSRELPLTPVIRTEASYTTLSIGIARHYRASEQEGVLIGQLTNIIENILGGMACVELEGRIPLPTERSPRIYLERYLSQTNHEGPTPQDSVASPILAVQSTEQRRVLTPDGWYVDNLGPTSTQGSQPLSTPAQPPTDQAPSTQTTIRSSEMDARWFTTES